MTVDATRAITAGTSRDQLPTAAADDGVRVRWVQVRAAKHSADDQRGADTMPTQPGLRDRS